MLSLEGCEQECTGSQQLTKETKLDAARGEGQERDTSAGGGSEEE